MEAEAAEPLDEAEADALLSMLDIGATVLIAVSGGPDSTALMGLAALRAARLGGPPPAVAVVDHGLRPGSDAEAEAVERRAARLGLACAILRWTGDKPAAGLQRSARAARYRLLAAHARALGAGGIATAHTLDDQAETVLMRLAHGSGPAGLAGMRPSSRVHGVTLLRPLLSVPKNRLIATCGAHGWPWIGDPSNRDARFERTRWRQLMPLLAAEGLDAERMGLFARRMAEADAAVVAMARQGLARAHAAQAGVLDFRTLAELPYAALCRALSLWLDRSDSGEAMEAAWRPTRLGRIEAAAARLIEALHAGQPLTLTLGGQVLTLDAMGVLSQRPEQRRRGIVNPAGTALLGKPAGDA